MISKKKRIQPGERVPLRLTAAERKLILEGLLCLDEAYERIIRETPAGKPVMMTLDELDDFGGYVAAEANHCDDKKKQKRLDVVFGRIQGVLDRYTDEEAVQTIGAENAKRAALTTEWARKIAEWAAMALVAAEELRIKEKPLECFWLAPAQREVLLLVPGVAKTMKSRLSKDDPTFTFAEVAGMTMALADGLLGDDSHEQARRLIAANHLMERLQEGTVRAARQETDKRRKRKRGVDPATLFQFKITLIGSTPPIWRRIQVRDCTVDKLHKHIQTAMGWTNSHLHQFEIKGERYGDPELLEDGFEDFECVDSTLRFVPTSSSSTASSFPRGSTSSRSLNFVV
jgi:hypothetical protein